MAEIPALATEEDVVAILGRGLSEEEFARIDAILNKLSELFRKESGQLFTPGESTVRRKVNGEEVFLPQRPVAEVSSVVDARGRPVQFSWFGQWLLVPGVGSHELVTVTYKHGSEDIPPLVVQTIADAARQVLEVSPEAVSGITQVSQGGTSYTASATYATWAQGGSARLSPEDLKVARSFRPLMGNVWVGSA